MLQDSETLWRVGVAIAVLASMLLVERLWPRRPASGSFWRRARTNLGLVVIDTLALRVLLPVAAAGVAMVAERKGWGVLNVVPLPQWLAIVTAILALDLAIYAQHVAMHRLPILWRLHQVHHADRAFDVTTGVRFHPLEIIVSMLYKCCCVGVIGAPVVAVVAFEILLNAASLFNHGNVRLSGTLDARLRRVIVTPDMHRVHHAVYRDETDSNYGFFLSWWDRLFGTYVAEPRDGHTEMQIGLTQYADARTGSLWWCLVLPFVGRRQAIKPNETKH
ncbi:MAG: sterol desaturase family protein [Pseudomonadota bacterium]